MKDLKLELEKLFKKWKQDHIEDTQCEYNTPKYKGKLIPKENFISDGFCVSEIKEQTILYISKESHEYNTKGKNNSNLDEKRQHETQWLKYNFSENKNPIFSRRIKIMQDVLKEDINNITFMNINKRRWVREN